MCHITEVHAIKSYHWQKYQMMMLISLEILKILDKANQLRVYDVTSVAVIKFENWEKHPMMMLISSTILKNLDEANRECVTLLVSM